jgi:hypothetical protein
MTSCSGSLMVEHVAACNPAGDFGVLLACVWLYIQEYDYTDAEHQSALQKATRQYMAAFEVGRSGPLSHHADSPCSLV